jgi:cytoskeletal protein CcmA (bactofilin family)
VTGDLIAFAQSVRINGQVDGNVRTFNNNITITGTVAKNVMTFAETVTFDSNAKVGGSATCFCESLGLDGSVSRDLLLFIAHANLNGRVGGAVRAKGDTLIIGSTAVIDGAVHFQGNKQPEVSPSAKLASPVEFKQLEKRASYRTGHYYLWQVIWLAAFILFGLVLYSLMPKFASEAVKSAEQYGASAGLGVLVLFGVPIAAVIACITVVGLFIGISAFFIWYASLYFAQVIVGTVVGQWLMGRTNDFWPFVGRMAVGVVIVRVCTTIPAVGGWIKFLAILWGVGAISLAIFRRFQPVLATGGPNLPAVAPLPPNTTIGGPLPA